MALSNSARNKLFRLVQQCKKLLYQEISDQLQLYYGIFPKDEKVLLIEELTSTDADIIYTGKLLRDRLKYLATNLVDAKSKIKDSIDQLIREQAFSILNRMAALRMAEERGIVKESVGRFYNSEGFQVYDSITGQGATASSYVRYKWYIYAVFDELALDLPSIFDRFSPYALIFPSEKSLERLLEIINSEDISIHREEGSQPLNLWKQDETIGWIYQYYNSKEEIKAMRDASDAPRNSQELAVRNQFFTPRYVVQFLTDNSLGRIWYEMTKGKTHLASTCKYLIRRANEIFLDKGEQRPENQDESTDYVEYRPLKDPREILILDPACGSMHFGLYSFDLMEVIYQEAWDNHPGLLTDLRLKMTRQQFLNQVPELVIRHNIHGVDIDPRALQIAALSLWLRAQKSFEKLGLPAIARPAITRSNLVLAEAMPGNPTLLSELLIPLDKPLRQLINVIWEKMQLAGETGLLLRIENEIDQAIKEIAKDLSKETKLAQLKLDSTDLESLAAERSAIYATKKYRDDFLTNAESEVLMLLKQLAETATNGDAYQKLLFADDTARGFAFIELSRKQYDVIVMNPPFGSASINTAEYLQSNYPAWGKNILSAFFERMLELLHNDGLTGAIFDRTVVIKSSYESFRIKCLCGHITSMADTGWNVLEANVETTTLVLSKTKKTKTNAFIDVTETTNKGQELLNAVASISLNNPNQFVYFRDSLDFEKLPNSIIGYFFQKYEINNFKNISNLESLGYAARKGNDFVSFEHYRNFWEALDTKSYNHLYNGSPFTMFYIPYREISRTIYPEDYYKQHKSINIRNQDYHFKKGVGIGKFGDVIDAHVFKEGYMFTNEGMSISKISTEMAILLNGLLNSIYCQYTINRYCGLHKQAGYINLLPAPLPNEFSHNTILNQIFGIKRKWIALDETCLETRLLVSVFAASNSLRTKISELQNSINQDKEEYLRLVEVNDNFWLERANIPSPDIVTFENYKTKRPKENLISIDGITDDGIENNSILSFEIISNLMGISFGRWDIRSVTEPELKVPFGGFYDPLPFRPIISLIEIPHNYPIDVPIDGIFVQDSKHPLSIEKAISQVISVIWGSHADHIQNELAAIGKFKSLEEFISKPSGFFDFHYYRYTKSRREAPIYWPLSTKSGSYTIWIYYPKLNDQTLYKIVNNFIKPKQTEVQEAIRRIELNVNLDNKGKRELTELQELLHELLDMEKEVLRIASIPYRPNHDDGVLITAAPLYKLFRHNKWRSSTEECWKALEKGDYDWAHLAYSIWPERVTKKCRKDLSMAIAHGLTELCEIKPKEKKVRAKKEPKEIKKDLKLDL